MSDASPNSVRGLLLTRSGVVSLAAGHGGSGEDLVRAAELELAGVGIAVSIQLHNRLATCSPAELRNLLDWTVPALLAHSGANHKHEPLFRSFPQGIPSNTVDLWWKKVLIHFVQAEGQSCLFCGQVGTTHVLNPCQHVVCSNCFDGSSYSACPACEHHVDRSSPFFLPSPDRKTPKELVRFKRIDLINDFDAAARSLFVSLCKRTQALSPNDREALVVILSEYGPTAIDWLPELIPVRENIALVFGTLFQKCAAEAILPVARRYMKTATDVLRLIAVISGTDGSLQKETVLKKLDQVKKKNEIWKQIVESMGLERALQVRRDLKVPIQVNRFKVAKLSRSVRRSLLQLLNEIPRSRLIEDLLRHQSYWVWVGEFLHPHEYSKRFPVVAEAFQVIRKRAPDGALAPEFRTWNSKVERSLADGQTDAALELLCERPGEFARRLDFVLRSAVDIDQTQSIMTAFGDHAQQFATPVLVTLANHFAQRAQRAAKRVYWPKGKVGLGVFDTDNRPTLPVHTIQRISDAIDEELLRRFARLPHFKRAIVDADLEQVIVPFNERTSSASAVALPKGSRIKVPIEKTLRMFLHWCQPKAGGHTTDLDLSIAFYDTQWKYVGVCSYYQLKLESTRRQVVAVSAGDLRNAPWPDGATEFVDLHCEAAKTIGVRYAVMVVNNFAGVSFSQLERGFAGLMIRDDESGQHFDPRTVKLKFSLAGDNGIFLPLVLDLDEQCLHWLDVHSKGQLQMNNVATSNSDIATICPTLMTYFSSGVRPSMFELGLLHAAARCDEVVIRGEVQLSFSRQENESQMAFLKRMRSHQCDSLASPHLDSTPTLAMLFHGDMDLPDGSSVYALFAGEVASTMSASDFMST